jgi:hypothetical protein
MARPSSTRKLAKVARSSKGSSIRESSDRTFPLAVGAIIVVGVLLVFYGRTQRADSQSTEPRLAQDHWHAAYGVYLCDAFQPALTDRHGDEVGIHTHDDGIIHIHPASSAAAGERATIGKFFDEIDLEVSGDRIVMPDGTTRVEGETTCPNGKVGKVVLVEWANADDPAAVPRVIDGDIDGTRFANDRMAFTLAFVPEDEIATVPRPESIPTLDNLTDVPAAQGSSGLTVPGAPPDTSAGGTGTTGDTTAVDTSVPAGDGAGGPATTTGSTAADTTPTTTG